MSPTSVNAPPIPTPRRCSPPPRCPTRFSSETGVPDPSPQWTITRPSRMPAAPSATGAPTHWTSARPHSRCTTRDQVSRPATGTATFRRRTATATGTTPRIPVRPTSAAQPRRPRQGPPPCSVRHSSEGDRMELDPPVQHWLVEHAEDLGVDRSSISIGGNSAGANLAAALARKVRDAGGPQPILQLLEVPALDLTLATAREAAAAGGQDIAGELDVAVARYLSDPGAAREPLASPMLADDLNGLPPAVIFTAEHDPLRTEGERYAARLNAAGVPARATRHLGAMHATAMMTRTWAPAVAWQRGAAAALRSAHWDDAPVTGMAEADATTSRT